MKVNFGTLLLTVCSLLVFTSCGAKKTATKLEISTSAISMANNSFDGGLVIMGSAPGENFTYPISFNAGAGSTSINLELSRKNWTFSAVGWTGVGSPFLGTVKCDITSVNLDDDEHTVNLTLTQQNCESMTTQFGSSGYYTPGADFKALSIATCGWLYTDNAATPVNAATSINFCAAGTATFAPEFVKHAKSVKIEVPTIINGTVSSGISECIPADTNGRFTSALKIPTKGVPVKVYLFKDGSCPTDPDKLLVDYEFPNGIDFSGYESDHVLGPSASETKLFLSVNQTRRGFSKFFELGLAPSIKCGAVSCMNIPTLSSDRVISPGQEFVVVENSTPAQLCSNLILTGDAGFSGFVYNPSNCRKDEKGNILSRVSFTSLSSGNIFLAGTDFSGSLSVIGSPNSQLYQSGFELLGWNSFPLVNPGVKNSFRTMFEDHEDNARSSGLISKIREFFLPDGPLSILGDTSCAAGVNPDKIISLLDDGQIETARVRLSDISESAPEFICDDADPEATMCPPVSFNKRVHVSMKKPNSVVFDTRAIMKLNCTSKVGTLEMFENDEDQLEKKIIYWNTQDPSRERMELYSLNQEKNSSTGAPEGYSHEYVRIVEMGTNQVAVDRMNFNAFNNAGIWSSMVNKEKLFRGSNDVVHMARHISAEPTTDPYSIFGDAYYSLLRANSPSDDIGVAESPNKRYEVKAVVTGPACPRTVHLSIKDRVLGGPAIVDSPSLACGTPGFSYPPQISVNNNGKVIVAVATNDPVYNHKVDAYTYDGTNWSNFPNASGILEPITTPEVRVHMYNNDRATVYLLQSPTPAAPQALITVNFNPLNAAGTPLTIASDGGWDVRKFDISVDTSDRVWSFASFHLTLDQVSVSVVDNLFATVSTLPLSPGTVPDFNAISVRSVSGLPGAKFFLKFNDGVDKIKPYTFTEAAGIITPTFLAEIAVNNEKISPAQVNCTPVLATTFGSPGGACNLFQGAFKRPIKTQVDLSPASLEAGNFQNVFTSGFESLP